MARHLPPEPGLEGRQSLVRLAIVLPSNRPQGHSRLVAFMAIAASLALRLGLLRRHAFNPDEFQHLHGAWCIAHGLLPYRDYFEHHTPWLHFFLAPFLALFDVETNPASAEAFIFFARASMVVFCGLALALTYILGRIWGGGAVACTGTVLLATTVMFLDKTLEIRPDVPGVAFLLGSWVALLLAFRGREAGVKAGRRFAESGFLLGAALLCTQKVLFTIPGSVALWAVYLLEQRDGRRRRARDLRWWTAGALVPITAMLAVFGLRDGLHAFVDFNLLTNLGWPARLSPLPLLVQLFHENTLLVALGLAGLAGGTIRLFRPSERRAVSALIPLQALGLAGGVFAIPVPYAQYLVMLLPLLALLAARVLVQWVSASLRLRSPSARVGSVTALCAVAVAFTLVPLQIMAFMLRPSHTKVEDYLGRLRFVLTHTSPREPLFDGFSGLGAFRPHAYFYFFLHDEIRTLLRDQGLNRLFADLRDGVVAPEWVVMDDDVRALPPRIVAFLEENYEPAAVAPLWRLKDLWLDDGRWLDLGQDPTDALAGRGWYDAQRVDGRDFRRARGRRSSIRLPVRRPEACREVVVRAKLEYQSAAPTMELSVNGASIGVLGLSAGWQDYSFPLSRSLLRTGVNALEITYDPAPKRAGPSNTERDALVAVDGLRLECGAASAQIHPGARASSQG